MTSFLAFGTPSAGGAAPAPAPGPGSFGSAFSRWVIANHGERYRATVAAQRSRAAAGRFRQAIESSNAASPTDEPLVGIVGGGFAGLFAGLILQSLGIECEIFERSDRVGGRIDTWYSAEYDPQNPDQAGLYGELGGMRLPQFSADMLPVQQLALAINAVLERNGLPDRKVDWRRLYCDSPEQRLRYNTMPAPITALHAGLSSLGFAESEGGGVPDVWLTPQKAPGGEYLPVNQVLSQVNQPFLDAINRSFAEGIDWLMQYDHYSMWDYLATVFTLGDLGEFYDPALGAKSDLLPWSVASFLETTNVGTGMYSVSFVEMVIAVYDWGGGKDPYRPQDHTSYMLTVNQGMQRFPDACRAVLDLETGVLPADGQHAQVLVGLRPNGGDGSYSYNPPNLTPDARPHRPASAADDRDSARFQDTAQPSAKAKRRVFLRHRALGLEHDAALYHGHGGMKLTVLADDDGGRVIERQYPYVITTLPHGAYLNGEFPANFLHGLSRAKAQAIRECNYLASFKAFLTFRTQFWATHGSRPGVGAAATDRSNRQIIYPSYGYEASGGVLQVCYWDTDARRLGALSDPERINECLKGIAYLYPEVDVYAEFAGYDKGRTTKTWFWDQEAGGGASALYGPGQFKYIYPELLTPEFDGCLNFAGECCSARHGWIAGALDSACNAVHNILLQAGATGALGQLRRTWGALAVPDIAADPATENVLDYAYAYNEIDRRAASVAPCEAKSIYGDSTFEFTGDVPAFIRDYDRTPQPMKKTPRDSAVLKRLNNQWADNVARRAQVWAARGSDRPAPSTQQTAVELLERIYYGDNFQTIPAPRFWLKDDDEFARQQLGGCMPNLLTRVSLEQLATLLRRAAPPNLAALGPRENVPYVADYRRYLEACTVTPADRYLARPIVFFTVNANRELMPVAIQLEQFGELFTPAMANADNAWLLAKMQTNCAGQTLHEVGFHQLLTHQLAALVSIALFSPEVFTPAAGERGPAFHKHPVFRLLRPHLIKTVEFQQTIYNRDYNPCYVPFPATRVPNDPPGVYNLGSVHDLIFSCGRIGSYQLQHKMYNDGDGFRFLDQAIVTDAARRGVDDTPFSYPYVHDATKWYAAIDRFVGKFVCAQYPGGDHDIARDRQLRRFLAKLIPAFNRAGDGSRQAQRFPAEVTSVAGLREVLTMFIWQFSVQHTVVNDGAYNHAAFVPNAATLMLPMPAGSSSRWTPADVLACLPSQTATYPTLGNMTFMDVQINASVTGQGPYPETVFGRGVLESSIDVLQDSYGFADPELRAVVDGFYADVRAIGDAIAGRQAQDVADYVRSHPESEAVPETVTFDLITPGKVMNSIQT